MSMEYEHGISTGATYSRGGTLWKTRVDRERQMEHIQIQRTLML